MTDARTRHEEDPLHHVAKIRGMLKDAATHAREDVSKIDEPRAQALFETTSEVLDGLVKAYDHYEAGSEKAWRR